MPESIPMAGALVLKSSCHIFDISTYYISSQELSYLVVVGMPFGDEGMHTRLPPGIYRFERHVQREAR